MFTNIGRKVGVLTLSSLCFSASLALRPITSEAFSIAVISPPAVVSEPVDKVKLENLKAYDVIVFIDASHSMAIADCGGQSRWQWCKAQTMALSNSLKVQKVPLGDHLKMVAFSDNFKVYPDVNWDSVSRFFECNKPSGNTDMNRAIKSELGQYFAARKALNSLKSGGTLRPLLIAMITDGLPDRPLALKETIIEATKQMTESDEIAITFLQVGTDLKATKYLQELDECLVARKAVHDIVKSKTFEQINRSGLISALLQSVGPTEVAVK
ncbi:MAG: hypothetical protein WC028_09120 [Candidatus Obscuribacterales bacterium]